MIAMVDQIGHGVSPQRTGSAVDASGAQHRVEVGLVVDHNRRNTLQAQRRYVGANCHRSIRGEKITTLER